jgi:hypothetical protein
MWAFESPLWIIRGVQRIDLKKQIEHLCRPSAQEVEILDVPEMNLLTTVGEIGQIVSVSRKVRWRRF